MADEPEKIVSFKRGIYKDFRPKPIIEGGDEAPKDLSVQESANSSEEEKQARETPTPESSKQEGQEGSATAARAPQKGGPSMPRS